MTGILTIDDVETGVYGVTLFAMRSKADGQSLDFLDGITPVFLNETEITPFLRLARRDPLRQTLESDLRARATDLQGKFLVTSRVPLAHLRAALSDEQAADMGEDIKPMLSHVLWQTVGWQSAGAEFIEVCFNWGAVS
ncbi:hypothetical protein [Paraburkholderia sp. SIMBA_054]|uniref:hypothetical protein n=1 Tax=Paraburkholderia sp. SIMBA_054 TaxID=3085795 RepID=UPI00397A7E86